MSRSTTRTRVAAIAALLMLAGGLALALPASGEPAPAAPTVSIGFTGDTGATSNTAAVADAARGAGVSAFFNLGDMSYSQVASESAWCSFVTQHVGSAMSYELVAGNHEDQDGPDGLWSNFAQCLPDKLGATGDYPRQYFADYPASSPLVRFIMVSPKLTFSEGKTYWSYKAGTQGYNFAASAIDGARSAGIPFVVVGMHMYCLSMVNYPCAASADLMNLLVSKKVDLYLQAHDHGYARSKQLALGSSCPGIALDSFDPDCVANADPGSSYTAGDGTVLATVGPGGRSLNKEDPTNAQAPYFQTYMGTNNNPTYGFLKVDVSPTKLTGTFVRGAGGTYTDTFTLTRPESSSAPPSPSDTTSAPPSPTDTVSQPPPPSDSSSEPPSSDPPSSDPPSSAPPSSDPPSSAPPSSDPPSSDPPSSAPPSSDPPSPAGTTWAPPPPSVTTPTPSSTTTTLKPIADSWVGSDAPTTTHGTDKVLYADSSPTKVSFLKYDLTALAGKTITSAVLKVTTTSSAYSGSTGTDVVHVVDDNTWTEGGVTFQNRPSVGPRLGSVANTSGSSTTYAIELTGPQLQAALGGQLSLAIDMSAGDAFYVGSRESTTPPTLVLTTN